jgi:hypothetical protein
MGSYWSLRQPIVDGALVATVRSPCHHRLPSTVCLHIDSTASCSSEMASIQKVGALRNLLSRSTSVSCVEEIDARLGIPSTTRTNDIGILQESEVNCCLAISILECNRDSLVG